MRIYRFWAIIIAAMMVVGGFSLLTVGDEPISSQIIVGENPGGAETAGNGVQRTITMEAFTFSVVCRESALVVM